MDGDVFCQREEVILQEMGWRKVDGLLEFADRIQLQQVKQEGVDDVVWSLAPSYFRMLASENPGPFQDGVEKLIRQLLRRLALLIAKWVGMSLWTAAILAASYFLVQSDAEDKKQQLSLAMVVIFTAVAGALENLRGWCDDSKGYKDSTKCILRQLGFLSAFTNRGPILRVAIGLTIRFIGFIVALERKPRVLSVDTLVPPLR